MSKMKKETSQSIYLSNEEAVTHFSDTVYRVAFDIIKDEADAKDVFQEVFLRFMKYRKERAFNSMEHARAWFIRVTINCSRNLFTKKRKQYEMEAEAGKESLSEEAVDRYDILASVSELDEKYRIAIHLFYYEGYKIKEMATILGEKENTIKTRLARGKKQLKQILQEDQKKGGKAHVERLPKSKR